MTGETVVLVPVKSFDLAKGRLAEALDVSQRGSLARRLAGNVLRAAGPLPTFVVCDHADVASWAVGAGANVIWVNASGLNPSLTEALHRSAIDGFRRAIISHADLPLAEDLTWLETDRRQRHADIVIVPDRHGTGTNVMSLPIEQPQRFRLRYGPESCQAHRREAEQLGWTVSLVADEKLGWDLDTPEDLAVLQTTLSQPEHEWSPR